MLGLRKPNFKAKIIILKNLTMPKTVKGVPLRFFNIRSVAKYQKMKGGSFGDIKKLTKKVSQSRKKERVSLCRKSENLLLRNICKKKLAQRTGSNTNPLG